ncbi:MAG: rod shape-determining protein MreD [Pseudomonadota bacterium]
MIDPVTTLRLGYRAAFLAIAAFLMFVRLLPLSAIPATWPGPDLLLGMTIVWVLRRPDCVPLGAIVAVFLLDDLLSMRPPGLWTLIVLLGTEFMRSRAALTRDLPFLLEWLMSAAVILGMIVANRIALTVFMVPMTGFGPVLLEYLSTMIAYPVIVAVSAWALGLRKAAPGQVDALGHRL